MSAMEQSEPAKLIMTWDIASDKTQEYFEFVVREFIPGIQSLGFEIQDAWATAYGDRPQIQVGAVMADVQQIYQILETPAWVDLHTKLLTYVTNYNQKIVESRTRFQF